jgi:uncharacterized glyoxalase superfamily protein PhnB
MDKSQVKSECTLVPALRYRDPDTAIPWLIQAFGFEQHSIVLGEDGKAAYAQLMHRGSLIIVGPVRDSELDRLMKQPDEIGGAETQSCYLVVEDADSHYVRARAAGAKILLKLKNDDNGGRGYTCADPEGHVWNFGTFDPAQARSIADTRPFWQKALSGEQARRWGMLAGVGFALIIAGAITGFMASGQPWVGDKSSVEILGQLNQERDARQAAERAANAGRSELERERSMREAAQKTANDLEQRLAKEAAAKPAPEKAGAVAIPVSGPDLTKDLNAARTESQRAKKAAQEALDRLGREKAAKDGAEKGRQQAQEQLAQERRARERAELTVKEVNEQLVRERAAREAAERAAAQARAQRADQQQGAVARPVKAPELVKPPAPAVPKAQGLGAPEPVPAIVP